MRFRSFFIALVISIVVTGYVLQATAEGGEQGCTGSSEWEGDFLLHDRSVVDSSTNKAALDYMKEVVAAAQSKKLDDLVVNYKEKVIAEPDSALAHFALGYAYMVRGEVRYSHLIGEQVVKIKYLEWALRELAKAVKLDPGLREGVLVLGSHYVMTNPVKGVAVLKDWLKRNPNDTWAMFWIGMAYGTYSPNNPDQSSYCHDEQKSLEWFEKAASTAPDILRFRLTLGRAYASHVTQGASGNWIVAEPWRSKAITEFEAVQKLATETNNPDTAGNAGRTLAKLKAN